MTNKSTSQQDTISAITVMIDHCEAYLELPKKDEAMKQARIRHDNTIGQATYKANEERNQISSIMSTLRTYELSVSNALLNRGAKLPDPDTVDAIHTVSIAELESRRGQTAKMRDVILAYLRDIDEIVQFYGTVRMVGYILLGIIFLIAVLVLTGVVDLNA